MGLCIGIIPVFWVQVRHGVVLVWLFQPGISLSPLFWWWWRAIFRFLHDWCWYVILRFLRGWCWCAILRFLCGCCRRTISLSRRLPVPNPKVISSVGSGVDEPSDPSSSELFGVLWLLLYRDATLSSLSESDSKVGNDFVSPSPPASVCNIDSTSRRLVKLLPSSENC